MPSENALSFGHLIIPVLGLLIPIVAIVAHYLGKAYSDRQRHLTIRELARAGQPIPPELLAGSEERGAPAGQSDRANPSRLLLPAVVNVTLGLGLIAMFAVLSPDMWLWAIGLVPLCLGLGLLLLWVFMRNPPPKP